jgi:hypothetical protein
MLHTRHPDVRARSTRRLPGARNDRQAQDAIEELLAAYRGYDAYDHADYGYALDDNAQPRGSRIVRRR